jgi:hypothetical protein
LNADDCNSKNIGKCSKCRFKLICKHCC